MTLADLTPEVWRWIAVCVALVVGGWLVAFGLLDGNEWATLAGGVLGGGSGVAMTRATK